jgi:hypothetical protein
MRAAHRIDSSPLRAVAAGLKAQSRAETLRNGLGAAGALDDATARGLDTLSLQGRSIVNAGLAISRSMLDRRMIDLLA